MIESKQKYSVKPMPGRVAVKIEGDLTETKTGIILVGTSHQDRPTTGEIVAVSDSYEQDGEDYDPLFKLGDIVVFGKYTGTKVRIGQDNVIVLRENDILCKLIHDADGVEAEKVKVTDRHDNADL